MEALVKKDISKIKIDDIETIKEIYELIKNDNKVGYIIIKKDPKDQIKLFIEENQRSNGYGKLFFDKILNMLDNDIYLKTDNSHMINIIEYYGGKELSRENGIRLYVIPKRG